MSSTSRALARAAVTRALAAAVIGATRMSRAASSASSRSSKKTTSASWLLPWGELTLEMSTVHPASIFFDAFRFVVAKAPGAMIHDMGIEIGALGLPLSDEGEREV